MPAACAACLIPISRGEEFKLAGTEVFHLECAEGGRIENSVGTQNKQRIIATNRQLVAEREKLRALERRMEELLHDGNRERQLLLSENATLKRQAADYHAAEASARSAHRNAKRAKDERDQAVRELAQMRDERDAFRNQLTVERALGPAPAPARPIATTVTAPVETDADQNDYEGSIKRFELLELD